MPDSMKTSDDDFDGLVGMVLSDMRTEVPQSFFDAIKDAPKPNDVSTSPGYCGQCFRWFSGCKCP